MDSRRAVVFWECCECNGVNPHTSAWDAGGHEWCFASAICDHVRCSYCKHLDKEAKAISYCDGKPMDTPGRSNSDATAAPGGSESKSTGNATYESTGSVIETTSMPKSTNMPKRTSGKAPSSPKPSARAAPYPSSKRNSLVAADTPYNTPGITADEAIRWAPVNPSSNTIASTASRSPTMPERHISDMPFQCSSQSCEKGFMSLYALEQHHLKYHYQAPLRPQGAEITDFIEAVRQAGATISQRRAASANAGTPSSTFNATFHTTTSGPVLKILNTAIHTTSDTSVASHPNPPTSFTGPAFQNEAGQLPTNTQQSSTDPSTNPPTSQPGKASPSHATFWDAVGGRRELIGTTNRTGDDDKETNTDARANARAENPET